MDAFLSNLQARIGENGLMSYPLVFLGGVVVSFTPCVYPIIPITVAFIGAAGTTSLRRNFFLSISYVFGLSLVYALLGVFSSLTGILFGRIISSFWSSFFLGSIFILLGLSSLGFFALPLIGFRKTNSDRPKNYIGAFLVGSASAFAVGPCVAPALGVILAYVSSKKNIFFGFTLLWTFAMGMCFMLVILSAFSSLLKKLPMAGRVNVIIERVFGIILAGLGVFFLLKAWESLF